MCPRPNAPSTPCVEDLSSGMHPTRFLTLFPAILIGILLCGAPRVGAQSAKDSHPGLQQMIDAAQSNSVVQCDPNQQFTLSVPVKIRKPLTLIGLHARLPEKLGST